MVSDSVLEKTAAMATPFPVVTVYRPRSAKINTFVPTKDWKETLYYDAGKAAKERTRHVG